MKCMLLTHTKMMKILKISQAMMKILKISQAM